MLVCFACIANAFAQGVIDPNFIKVPVVTAIPLTPPANSEGRMVFVNILGNKQLYVWNGTTWAAVAGSGGGSLTPPIILTGTGIVLSSNATDATGRGILGTSTTGTGVEGNVGNGKGVAGYSHGGIGVLGQSYDGTGGSFQTSSNTDAALFANTSGTGGTAVFFNDAASSTKPTLRLGNQGNGRTLEVINDGKGNSGFFETRNAAATAPALYVGTYSTTQPAARFVGANALQADGVSNFNGKINANSGIRLGAADPALGKVVTPNIYGDLFYGNATTINEMYSNTNFGIPPNGWHPVAMNQQGVIQGLNNTTYTGGGVDALPFDGGFGSTLSGYFFAQKNGVYSIDFRAKWFYNPGNTQYRIRITNNVTGTTIPKTITIGDVINPSFKLFFVANIGDFIYVDAYHTTNISIPVYPCGDPWGFLPSCPSIPLGNIIQSASATIVSY